MRQPNWWRISDVTKARQIVYGIIALDISLVTNPTSEYLVADSIEAMAQEVEAVFERFHAEFSSDLNYHRDKRILCKLLFAKILGYHTGKNRHINIEKFGAHFHARLGTLRGNLAAAFYNPLI